MHVIQSVFVILHIGRSGQNFAERVQKRKEDQLMEIKLQWSFHPRP